MKAIIAAVALLGLTGCISKVEIRYTDGNGRQVTESRWESQKTTRSRMKLEFYRSTMTERGNDIDGTADFKQGSCDHITAPEGIVSEALWMKYYDAAEDCALASGRGNGNLDHRSIAAIRGTPTTDFGWATQEIEKTERFFEQQKTQRINAWSAIGLGIANIGKDLYIADNFGEGSTGNGGVYVRGDVITTQTGSNSGAQGGNGGSGPDGDGSGDSGSGTSGDQSRAIGQSVFGNNTNSFLSDASHGAFTGSGPTINLEPSANGFATEDSELKGVIVSDQWDQNADFNYDDGKDGINADF